MRKETVLRGRNRERRRQKRKKTALKKFRSRTKKRDGTIRSGNRRWFSRFRDRKYQRLLPDGRKDRMTDREVKDRGEVGDGAWPKVFQVDHCDVVRASGS